MSKNINVNIRMDEDLKKEADKLFSELGLNMTTAINAFARQAVRQGCIPFNLTLNNPNKETLEAMEEVRSIKENPALGKKYDDVDEMMKELLG